LITSSPLSNTQSNNIDRFILLSFFIYDYKGVIITNHKSKIKNQSNVSNRRSLSVSLPDTLDRLTNLTNLILSNNQLTILPRSISRLNRLKFLDIDDNQMTELPEWLQSMQQTQQLSLEY